MATPIGHSLLGIVFAKQFNKNISLRDAWKVYFLAIVCANAPDFDFIPGLLIGEMHRYHQGITHSFVYAICIGLCAAIVAPKLDIQRLKAFMVGFFACCSHLLMDFFGRDGREPIGMPLFWPFLDSHWISPTPLLLGVRHGRPGDSKEEIIQNLFSMHNAMGILFEIGFCVIVFLIFAAFHFGKTIWQKG